MSILLVSVIHMLLLKTIYILLLYLQYKLTLLTTYIIIASHQVYRSNTNTQQNRNTPKMTSVPSLESALKTVFLLLVDAGLGVSDLVE